MLYRTPLRMLSDLLSPKALERILDSGARARGKSLADLDHADLADLLKRDVFKRLQLSVPAQLAKKRIQDVLETLEQDASKSTSVRNEDVLLANLEASAKRFSLYFDWPEAQKLRALLGVARTEMEAGKSVPGLIDEGMGLIAALERRLNEGLVAQASDLAELKAELSRFSGIGGPKLRRLEGLIAQIEDAQKHDTLSPAEVERARHLALDLRKLVESSVISPVTQSAPEELPDPTLLTPEAQARLRELDRESEARDLQDLRRDHAALLRARPDLAAALSELEARSAALEVLGPAVGALRDRFSRERDVVVAEQKNRLTSLGQRLEALGPRVAQTTRDDARLALEIARGVLSSGSLASDELGRLESTIATLESSQTQVVDSARTERLLALQRETYELETAARGVRGAEIELAPRIAEARAALERGELVGLDDLWGQLERRMAQLAQEREGFDTRADTVIEEYDRYRHLAGETIQRLGRLADNLRRVRRLGQLSIEARGKYEETLVQAEALVGEARAEFEAARELTSTFGEDALSDLLGVFDSPSLFGEATSTPAPVVPTSPPAEPLAATLTSLSARGGARLAVLRGDRVSWGDLDSTVQQVALDIARAASRLFGTRIASVEFGGGALLVLPLRDAVVVAHVEDTSSQEVWRQHLLDARATLA